MTLGPDDLIASYFTLTGSSVMDAPRFSFDERVEAAAAAGFAGIGLMVTDYEAMRGAGRSAADLQAVADSHGVAVGELEFLYDWHTDGERGAEASRYEGLMYEMADAFGSRHMNCGVLDPPGSLPPLDVVAERFAGVCDRAADHGLLVAFEFLPWTAVPDVRAAWDIVRTAGRPNGGVLVDSWHHFRGSADEQAIRAVPPENITAIQLDDADAEQIGSLEEDTCMRRRLPGRGAFDLTGFVTMLDEMGVAAPISVEVMSSELQALDVEDAARQVHDATADLVAKARSR
jgi:sugar phosphate isomerase/epimerase